MVSVVSNLKVSINVYSEDFDNGWMDAIFVVCKADERKAVEVLKAAWSRWWEDEEASQVPYGDWLESSLAEAGIKYEAYYKEEERDG